MLGVGFAYVCVSEKIRFSIFISWKNNSVCYQHKLLSLERNKVAKMKWIGRNVIWQTEFALRSDIGAAYAELYKFQLNKNSNLNQIMIGVGCACVCVSEKICFA
jgi:hypothetical protein